MSLMRELTSRSPPVGFALFGRGFAETRHCVGDQPSTEKDSLRRGPTFHHM